MQLSKIDMIFGELIDGNKLTTKEIRKKFKLSNPRDPIYRLRQEGFPVTLVRLHKTKYYVLNSSRKAASTYKVVGN